MIGYLLLGAILQTPDPATTRPTPVTTPGARVSTTGACSAVIINTQGNVTNICISDVPAWVGRFEALSARLKNVDDCAPDAETARRALALGELDQAEAALRRVEASGNTRPTANDGAVVTAVGGRAIIARAPGDVVSVAVAPGQTIRRGQLLARLDPRNQLASLEAAQAGLSRHTELMEAAGRELSDLEARLAKGIIFKEQVDQKRSEQASYRLLVQSDRVSVMDARLALGRAAITSPFSGVVKTVRVRVGDPVKYCSVIIEAEDQVAIPGKP